MEKGNLGKTTDLNLHCTMNIKAGFTNIPEIVQS